MIKHYKWWNNRLKKNLVILSGSIIEWRVGNIFFPFQTIWLQTTVLYYLSSVENSLIFIFIWIKKRYVNIKNILGHWEFGEARIIMYLEGSHDVTLQKPRFWRHITEVWNNSATYQLYDLWQNAQTHLP